MICQCKISFKLRNVSSLPVIFTLLILTEITSAHYIVSEANFNDHKISKREETANENDSIEHDCEIPELTGGKYIDLRKNLVKLECDDNYVYKYEPQLVSTIITCEHDEWKSNQSCTPKCKVPNQISVSYTCTYNENTSKCTNYVNPGTTYVAECAYGYINKIPSERNECTAEGDWKTPPDFECGYDCGRDSTYTPLISIGVKAQDTVPWNTAIYILENNGTWRHVCGGSLISAYAVVTAAHCVVLRETGNSRGTNLYRDVSKVRVGVGKYYSDYNQNEMGAAIHEVAEFYSPDAYETGKFSFDIALIRLKQPVIFSKKILPVCVPDEFVDLNNKIGVVFGWGLDENRQAKNELYSVRLPYYDRYLCNDHVPDPSYLTEDKFCAFLTNGTSVQEGDSGAGYTIQLQENGITRHHIFGVVSTHVEKTNTSTFTNIGFNGIMQFVTRTFNHIKTITKD